VYRSGPATEYVSLSAAVEIDLRPDGVPPTGRWRHTRSEPVSAAGREDPYECRGRYFWR